MGETRKKECLLYILCVFFVIFNTVTGTPAQDTCEASTFGAKKEAISTEMGMTIIKDTDMFNEMKYSYHLVSLSKSKIEPKNQTNYPFVSIIETIKRTDESLDNYHANAIETLKQDLNFTELPKDLKNKINRQIKRAKDVTVDDRQDDWIEAYLTPDYGGTSKVGFALIGFKVDPCNTDNIIMGIIGYREEWTEQDNVRPIIARWKKDDLRNYIKYKLYMELYPFMNVNARKRINSKSDLTSPIESVFIDGEYVELINGNVLGCQAMKTNIIFISDRSGSMYSNDEGKSEPKDEQFILDDYLLKNRLGCLYSAIHKFIKVRTDNRCNDIVSSILFNDQVNVVSNRQKITSDYVKNVLIQHHPGGGTDFEIAFQEAKKFVRYHERTIVIFLTDGEATDNGVSNIVSEWSNKMGDLLSFFCMVLGNAGSNAVNVVETICQSGNGQMKTVLNGPEMIKAYEDIAWQETR